MVDTLQLFRGGEFKVNDYLTVRQPTLGEICDYGEIKYFNLVASLCATPSDYKVALWDMDPRVDWEETDEFELFHAFAQGFSVEDTRILLGDFPLNQLWPVQHPDNGELAMVRLDQPDRVVLDRFGYTMMTDFLRKSNGLEKNVDKAGSLPTKLYLIERDRNRIKANQRRRNKDTGSTLQPLISAMVNCEQFKYDHKTVWDLPIYAFFDSVKRIQKLKYYNQVMAGIYAGTVDMKKISQDSLNWMGDLK